MENQKECILSWSRLKTRTMTGCPVFEAVTLVQKLVSTQNRTAICFWIIYECQRQTFSTNTCRSARMASSLSTAIPESVMELWCTSEKSFPVIYPKPIPCPSSSPPDTVYSEGSSETARKKKSQSWITKPSKIKFCRVSPNILLWVWAATRLERAASRTQQTSSKTIFRYCNKRTPTWPSANVFTAR